MAAPRCDITGNSDGINQANKVVLPKNPVPTLERTFDRYLDFARTYSTPEEFEKTQGLVEDFLTHDGPRLQEEILKLAETKENWVCSGLGDICDEIQTKNRRLYTVKTVRNGAEIPLGDIYRQLRSIVSSTNETDSLPVSLLTAGDRDEAATVMGLLKQDGQNRTSLKKVQTSAFFLCLDLDAEPLKEKEKTGKMRERALHVFSGGGPESTGCNRWFDKCLQFIVADNGVSGLNSEHSPADGENWVPLQHQILDDLKVFEMDEVRESCQFQEEPTVLKFNSTQKIDEMLFKIKEDYRKLCFDLAMEVVPFNDFGREYPKTRNFSPDAFIQIALNLSYYKMHGEMGNTFESGSVRRFREGRVDLIRSNTPETLRFAQIFMDKAAKEVVSGKGMDSHMRTLMYLSMKFDPEHERAKVFQDPFFKTFNRFPIGTSSVLTRLPMIGYPPYEEDGYGVAYIPGPDSILFTITSKKSCSTSSAKKLADIYMESLRELRDLLDRNHFKTKF